MSSKPEHWPQRSQSWPLSFFTNRLPLLNGNSDALPRADDDLVRGAQSFGLPSISPVNGVKLLATTSGRGLCLRSPNGSDCRRRLRPQRFRENDRYGVFGRFITSQSLNAYYNWEGIFVSSGIWVDQRPQTQSYLVRSESKDDEYKVVIMDEHSTQLFDGREAEFEILPKPNGTDLISGLMFTPQCYTGAFVHDGEDTYPIRLLKTGSSKLSKRRGFFAGPVTRCDYEITTRRGKKRRLRVSMAEHDGMWVAAEVRVRLALFPDPVFRLRS